MNELNKHDETFKEEKIDGKIYLMARPSDEHEGIQTNISFLFSDYFRKNKKFCRVMNEAELYIDNNGNYVVPDLMVFCGDTSKHIPLIVIEVLSKWTKNRDLGIKMEKYAALGIKEYWIVDPKDYTISVYLLTEDKIYKYYKTYVYSKAEEFSKRPEVREKEEAEATIEFSPVSMPDMVIKTEDVFTFYDFL
jgi:Uma2 family endonuclease